MRTIGKAISGLAAVIGLGCATGANEPQAPDVRYEHTEVIAEGTMEDGTPARIVQTAYGDANTLAVRKNMEVAGQVVGAMGWSRTEENGVCRQQELYLHEVDMFGVPFSGENTLTDLACDHRPDYITFDGLRGARGAEFGDEMDELYMVLEEVLGTELNVQQHMQEWNEARGL